MYSLQRIGLNAINDLLQVVLLPQRLARVGVMAMATYKFDATDKLHIAHLEQANVSVGLSVRPASLATSYRYRMRTHLLAYAAAPSSPWRSLLLAASCHSFKK